MRSIIYQDRLGTGMKNKLDKKRVPLDKKRVPFLRFWKTGCVRRPLQPLVKKRHSLRHLYIKCIILPRHARDKHRENLKKSGRPFP